MSNKILCIQTTNHKCEVCLSVNGNIEGLERSDKNHSQILIQQVNTVLKKGGIQIPDAVAISRGPGSYTGLRVGFSVAKGLAFAWDIPIMAINTLECLAQSAHIQFENLYKVQIFSILKARKNEVYFAHYDHTLSYLKPPSLILIENLISEYFSTDVPILIVCGDDVQELLNPVFDKDNINIFLSDSHIEGLSQLALKYYEKREFAHLDSVEPFYMKPPNIAKKKSYFGLKTN